jgi:hypothetical protein
VEQEQQTTTGFCGMLGRALLLPFRAVAYVLNPLNCCNSSDEIRRDTNLALKEMRDGRPRISLHAEMLQSSTELGMKILKVESGYVAFSIPERLAGKIHKVKQKKVDSLQEAHPNIKLSKSEKAVIIEIDVESIQKDLDPKKNKDFIQRKIGEEVHSNLKALMKITGGSGGRTAYGDRKLSK